MKNARGVISIVTAGILLAFAAVLAAEVSRGKSQQNWPQWRGPAGTGASTETGIPLEWSAEKNLRWKTAIPGRGHSSPVIWQNRVFLTTDIQGDVIEGAKAVVHMEEGKEFKHPDAIGADRRHTMKVISLDRDTGKILWEKTVHDGPVYDDRHRKGSYAAPTPVTDGKRVISWFGSEGLFCHDFIGRELWRASLGQVATMGLGVASSPILWENLVIVLCDEDTGEKSFIAALNKETGKEVWRTPRKVQANWSTPILARGENRTELVCSGNEWIVSYDPATGKELWKTKGHGSNAIGTPLAGLGMVFAYAGFPEKKTMAIRLGGSGEISGSQSIPWTYGKGTAYVPSSILYGDYVYLMSDRGMLTCLDAKTGAVQYDGGRVPIPATFTASPVAVDRKILLTSEDGDTFVIKAGPKHEVLTTNSIGEPVFASVAISQGMVFIRGEKNLFCIGGEGAK
jgi:outer membrane protein assembly factor BamB